MGSLDRTTLSCTLWILLSLLGVATVSAQQRDEPATKFERFTLRKGIVVVREHHDVGSIVGEHGGRVLFQVSRAYSFGPRDTVLAIRIEVFESTAGSRERSVVGVLDADEVASLQAALPHMRNMLTTMQQSNPKYYTEVEFKGGTIVLGFFVGSSSGSSRPSLFIQAGGPIGGTMAFIAISKFAALEQLVTESVTKLTALQKGQ
jgi:hypothetical protein